MRRTLWSSCCSWIPCQRRRLLWSSSHQLSYNCAPQTARAECKKHAVGQERDPVWHSMLSPGEHTSIKTVPSDLLLLLCTAYLSSPSMSSVESFPSLKVLIDLLTPAQARVHLGKISTTEPDFLIKTEFTPVNTVLHSSRAQDRHLTLSPSQYMQVKWRQTTDWTTDAAVLSHSKRQDSRPVLFLGTAEGVGNYNAYHISESSWIKNVHLLTLISSSRVKFFNVSIWTSDLDLPFSPSPPSLIRVSSKSHFLYVDSNLYEVEGN